jgi:hypothetical protein
MNSRSGIRLDWTCGRKSILLACGESNRFVAAAGSNGFETDGGGSPNRITFEPSRIRPEKIQKSPIRGVSHTQTGSRYQDLARKARRVCDIRYKATLSRGQSACQIVKRARGRRLCLAYVFRILGTAIQKGRQASSQSFRVASMINGRYSIGLYGDRPTRGWPGSGFGHGPAPNQHPQRRDDWLNHRLLGGWCDAVGVHDIAGDFIG